MAHRTIGSSWRTRTYLLARLQDKVTSILLLSVLTTNIITAGCSFIKEYPKDWPKQVAISPSICPSLVGSYADRADISDRHRAQVTIAMPNEGVLKYEYRTDQMIIQKEYSSNDKTLICSEKNALLDEGIKWDVYGGGLVSKRIMQTLSKDGNGHLILEEKHALTFWFVVFFPVFKYSENWWGRYAPINDIVKTSE